MIVEANQGCAPVLGQNLGGLGLFDSGLDLTSWSITDWIVAAAAVYLAFKLFGDVRRVRGARSARRKSKVAARRKRLQAELDATR